MYVVGQRLMLMNWLNLMKCANVSSEGYRFYYPRFLFISELLLKTEKKQQQKFKNLKSRARYG